MAQVKFLSDAQAQLLYHHQALNRSSEVAIHVLRLLCLLKQHLPVREGISQEAST